MPAGSRAGISATALTTPEVPIDTTTSPGSAPTPKGSRGVVAGAWIEQRAAHRLPGGGGRTEHCRHLEGTTEGALEQFGPIGLGDHRPVAGPARVTTVAAQRRDPSGVAATAEPPGQPVMRMANGRLPVPPGRARARRITSASQPGSRRPAPPRQPRPMPPPAEIVDEVPRRASRAGVVPEPRRAHHLAVLVEADHTVLLAPDATAATSSRPPARASASSSADHHAAGSTSVPVRVCGPTFAHQRPGRSVAHNDPCTTGSRSRCLRPAPRCGRRRQRAPIRCSTASWSSTPNAYPLAPAASASNVSYDEGSASRSP